MSIEAELVIEQMKEQHHRDLSHLRLELEEKVSLASQPHPLVAGSPVSTPGSCRFFLTGLFRDVIFPVLVVVSEKVVQCVVCSASHIVIY